MTAIETVPPGYMRDAQGRLVPESAVGDQDKLIDQTVAKIVDFARALNAQIARFKGHTIDDITSLNDLLGERYGAARGGVKGNITLTSFDGCKKVMVQVSEAVTYGPELQIAKTLVDQCIAKWSEGANDAIRALVNHAFQVDKAGKINHAALLQLRRVKIDDPDWQNAMQALVDAMRVIGSKAYVRFYERDNPSGEWRAITIDLAAA